MPDANGRFKGIAVPALPWQGSDEDACADCCPCCHPCGPECPDYDEAEDTNDERL